MCFFIHEKYSEAKIAEKNITCYKIMRKNYKSFIRGFNYKPLLDKKTPTVNIKVKNKYILKGYHSYSNKKFTLSVIAHTKFLNIIICTIPKGTKYYYDPKNKEYVSETIIIHKINDAT